MKGRVLLAACLLASLAGAASGKVFVEILSPALGESLFDEVEVTVEVVSAEPIVRVELFVDGRLAGTLTAPPYRWRIDVGARNREHEIEVVAHGRHGAMGRASRVAPALLIHERMDLGLQQLYVTVTDGDRRVLDLEAGNFEIHDRDLPQEIVTFARGDIPFTAVLLLDGSFSMASGGLEIALDGARRFLDAMRPLDEARLVAFSDQPLLVTPFVGDSASVAESLDATTALGGTAILDHLHMALLLLEARQGRRVVILLSDGWDLHSVLAPDQVASIARRSQAIIYWVRRSADRPARGIQLSDPAKLIPLSNWYDQAETRRRYEELEKIVRGSGGRIETISQIEEVDETFQGILDELREQYALGYYPDPRRLDGVFREVRVKVDRRGLAIRTRDGYVDR